MHSKDIDRTELFRSARQERDRQRELAWQRVAELRAERLLTERLSERVRVAELVDYAI